MAYVGHLAYFGCDVLFKIIGWAVIFAFLRRWFRKKPRTLPSLGFRLNLGDPVGVLLPGRKLLQIFIHLVDENLVIVQFGIGHHTVSFISADLARKVTSFGLAGTSSQNCGCNNAGPMRAFCTVYTQSSWQVSHYWKCTDISPIDTKEAL